MSQHDYMLRIVNRTRDPGTGISSEVVEKSSEVVETLASARLRIALPKRTT